MPLFTSLALKLSPLYFNIFLGYIAGKKLDANRDTIAKIMFYMISPMIIFNGVLSTQINMSVLSLPFLTFILACGISLFFYRLSRYIWTDASRNIMAFSAGSGNTGYFGIPLAMIILEPQAEGIYIMSLLGITLYENSLGYYLTMKGSTETFSQCLLKLLRLPAIYAFFFGLCFNLYEVSMPEMFTDFIGHIKGVYIVLGMMIIGLGLAGLNNFKLDFKFIGMTFLAKFFVWPLLVIAIVAVDTHFLGLYESTAHQALILISIVPLAVNTVVMASLTNWQPEKTAATVFLSALFALFYVPLMTLLFIKVK